jgi:hypothetical protein
VRTELNDARRVDAYKNRTAVSPLLRKAHRYSRLDRNAFRFANCGVHEQKMPFVRLGPANRRGQGAAGAYLQIDSLASARRNRQPSGINNAARSGSQNDRA